MTNTLHPESTGSMEQDVLPLARVDESVEIFEAGETPPKLIIGYLKELDAVAGFDVTADERVYLVNGSVGAEDIVPALTFLDGFTTRVNSSLSMLAGYRETDGTERILDQYDCEFVARELDSETGKLIPGMEALVYLLESDGTINEEDKVSVHNYIASSVHEGNAVDLAVVLEAMDTILSKQRDFANQRKIEIAENTSNRLAA